MIRQLQDNQQQITERLALPYDLQVEVEEQLYVPQLPRPEEGATAAPPKEKKGMVVTKYDREFWQVEKLPYLFNIQNFVELLNKADDDVLKSENHSPVKRVIKS